jgi:hypothetical protein
MSAGDVVYIYGATLATVAIPSLFTLPSLWGAGPRYRAALLRQLGVGWAAAALLVGWLTLGWFALGAGGRWFGTYREFTLVLLGASAPLLFVGIRTGTRSLAAAQAADRDLPA